jgi:hypothetical protein
MSKKKPTPKKAAPVKRQSNIFVLRGTPEFKAWMDELATLAGSPVSVMTERAMRELAKKLGHRPPPRRVP